MDKKLIEKINYYTNLSRQRPLTPAETADRMASRQQYLSQFKSQFKSVLDQIEFTDEKKN